MFFPLEDEIRLVIVLTSLFDICILIGKLPMLKKTNLYG